MERCRYPEAEETLAKPHGNGMRKDPPENTVRDQKPDAPPRIEEVKSGGVDHEARQRADPDLSKSLKPGDREEARAHPAIDQWTWVEARPEEVEGIPRAHASHRDDRSRKGA